MIVGFDETAKLAITDAAQAAYLASGLQNQPGMPRRSPCSAGRSTPAPPAVRRAYDGPAMWMPRASASYLLGDRTVLKGGYGLYYDTLNAADYVAAQAATASRRRRRSPTISGARSSGPRRRPAPAASIRSRSAPTARAGIRSSATRSASTRCSAAPSATENGCAITPASSAGASSLQRQLSARLGVEVAYAGAYNDSCR
jgi:hypothetical protein